VRRSFPHGGPSLDAHHRAANAIGSCLAAVRALGQSVLDYPNDGIDAGFPFDRRVLVGLERLHRIVVPVRTIQQRARLFDELRDIKKAVEEIQTSLKQCRPERGPAEDLRKAIDLILNRAPATSGASGGAQRSPMSDSTSGERSLRGTCARDADMDFSPGG